MLSCYFNLKIGSVQILLINFSGYSMKNPYIYSHKDNYILHNLIGILHKQNLHPLTFMSILQLLVRLIHVVQNKKILKNI